MEILRPSEPEWVHTFLNELSLTGIERVAAKRAFTTMAQVRKYKEACVEFALACDEYIQEAIDSAELEMRRRAVEGYEKGVYFKGELMDTEVVYSDALLLNYLKAKRSKEFGDKKQITGGDGEPFTINIRTFPTPNQQTPAQPSQLNHPATQLNHPATQLDTQARREPVVLEHQSALIHEILADDIDPEDLA